MRLIRPVVLLAATAALAACAPAPVKTPPPAPQAPQPEPTPPPAPAPSGPVAVAPTAVEAAQFQSCMTSLRAPAIAAGVNATAFDQYAMSVMPDMGVLPLLDRQPEFSTPLWDYLAALVDSRRIREGRERLAANASLLQQVQARTGVDPATVVAVWGVESDYGQNFGKRPLLQS